jgi:hypothetical protein
MVPSRPAHAKSGHDLIRARHEFAEPSERNRYDIASGKPTCVACRVKRPRAPSLINRTAQYVDTGFGLTGQEMNGVRLAQRRRRQPRLAGIT